MGFYGFATGERAIWCDSSAAAAYAGSTENPALHGVGGSTTRAMSDDGPSLTPFAGDVLDDDEEDWFGEGTAFDSGEDLAAALFAIAGVDDGQGAAATFIMATAAPSELERPATPVRGQSITVGDDAFEVIERPQAGVAAGVGTASPWGVRAQPGVARTSWSMRHSVQFIKMTEEVIKRLRQEAIELSWMAAAVAMAQARAAGLELDAADLE